MDLGELVKQIPCPENASKICYITKLEIPSGIQEAMWLYKVFQNGLVFISLLAGCFIIGHLVYCTSAKCRNWFLIFTTVVTGFFHTLVCLFLLGISELSAYTNLSSLVPNSGHQDCVNYSPSANLANAIVLTLIAINVLKQNSSSTFKMHCAIGLQTISSLFGLVLLTRSSESSRIDMRQRVFLTLGERDRPHLDVFWSVCQKDIMKEHYNLVCEYGLIYVPVAITIFIAWHRTYRKTGDIALIRIKVLNSSCKGSDFCYSCICTKLNTAFAALLFYSFLVLFVGRPAMIIYGYMTSGFFRDILPSLLQTVTYCFVCSEYLMWCYRMHFRRPRLSSVNSKIVMCV